MKKWYQSRTVWVFALTVFVAVGNLVAQFVGQGVFTAEAIILLLVGVAGILLRLITEQPIENKNNLPG